MKETKNNNATGLEIIDSGELSGHRIVYDSKTNETIHTEIASQVDIEALQAAGFYDLPVRGEPQTEACPMCFQRGEILDIGEGGSNYGACHTHKLYWWMWLATIPEDAFKDQWEANREKIKGYQRVRAVMIKWPKASQAN